MKLIATNRSDVNYPKFIPQIKATCRICGRYIKFLKQDQELIDEINNQQTLIEEWMKNQMEQAKNLYHSSKLEHNRLRASVKSEILMELEADLKGMGL